MQEVGRVTHTYIYPIKGMRGVLLDSISLKSISVTGDRGRAFLMQDMPNTPNTLDTIQYPGLLQYQPVLSQTADIKNARILVQTPTGDTYDADDPALLKEISTKAHRKINIVRIGRGMYHSMPLSLLTWGSLHALEDRLRMTIDPRRFRENVYIQTRTDIPYEEDSWIGSLIQFGKGSDAAYIAVIKADKRCATINLDPEHGVHDDRILKDVVKEHEGTLGVYATIVREGVIHTGDPVFVSSFSGRLYV